MYFFKCKFRLWHLQLVHRVFNEQIGHLDDSLECDCWRQRYCCELLSLQKPLKLGYVTLCLLESMLCATNENRLTLGLAKWHILSRFYVINFWTRKVEHLNLTIVSQVIDIWVFFFFLNTRFSEESYNSHFE